MGGVGNQVAKEDYGGSHVGSNQCFRGLESRGLGSRKARCSTHSELFLRGSGECRRDNAGLEMGDNVRLGMGTIQNHAGRKEMKGLLLLGHEKLPCGFGLINGDHGSDTAEGTGNDKRLSSRAWVTGKNWESGQAMDLYFFLRYDTPDWHDWAKWGRKGCVCLCAFQGTLRFLTITFCHYSKSV